jgi:uncharacterized protein YgiM (DUF1202 family)
LQHAVTLVEGLQLSSKAATGTASLRGLKKGEALVLVGITSNNWLQLRDVAGRVGYVANRTTAIRIQK